MHLNKVFNKILIKNYLISEEFKMRHLISQTKGLENFVANHTAEVKAYKKRKQMLFRAKYKDVDKLFLEVISIWDNKRHYNKFFKKNKGKLFLNELKREGFQVHITKKYINGEDIKSLLKKFKDKSDNSRIEFNNLII